MLDLDHGTYPYVTSSNPVAGYASVGSGIGPVEFSEVWGVTKAYTTRVGEGPFPTELTDGIGETLREVGNEFGTTTGRPRRCGWLDLVALRYAARVNGLTGLCITKLDVLDDLETIKVCTKYKYREEILDELPPAQADLRRGGAGVRGTAGLEERHHRDYQRAGSSPGDHRLPQLHREERAGAHRPHLGGAQAGAAHQGPPSRLRSADVGRARQH